MSSGEKEFFSFLHLATLHNVNNLQTPCIVSYPKSAFFSSFDGVLTMFQSLLCFFPVHHPPTEINDAAENLDFFINASLAQWHGFVTNAKNRAPIVTTSSPSGHFFEGV